MKEKIVSYLGARHRGNPQCLVFHHLGLTKPLVDEWAFVTPHIGTNVGLPSISLADIIKNTRFATIGVR